MTGQSKRVSYSRRQVLGAVGTTGAFGLAGCAAVTGGTNDADPIRLAYMPIYPDMQYFVMDQEGYLDELDAPVEAEQFPDGPSIVQALAGGGFDVALFGMVPSMVAIDKGLPYRVTAANIVDAMSVMTTDAFAELWADHGAAAFAQFEADRGRKFRFGTFPPGSVPDIVLRYWLREELGLVVEDAVDVVPMGAGKVRQAMLAGEIDGTSIMEPIQTLAIEKDTGHDRLVNAADFFPGGQPAAVVLMNDRLRTENSDLGRAFLERHVRATEFANENPDQAAAHATTVVGEEVLPLPIAKKAMRSPTANFISDPHEIEGGTEIFASFASDLGKTDRTLALEEVFDVSLFEAVEG
ncbi:MAG: ABC transporter substrate-binding protein [Haloarculaceae archaeon]